jgi:predicted amidohydrolase YtcJ
MCVACGPGIAALARGAPSGPTAPAFAPAEATGALAAAQPERAVILRGGPILTMDDANPVGEALAIRGSEILEVGSLTEVKRHYTPGTEIVDLQGHAVLPGFVDPHVHVLQSALAETGTLAGGECPPASVAAGIDGEAAELLERAPGRVAELTARALREFAMRGCTTVYDSGIGLLAGAREHELLRALAHAPDAPVRIRGAFAPELAAALGAAPGAGDERYDVVGIAYRADGSLLELAAALGEPYLGGRGYGRLRHETAELREQLRGWHRAGWQLVVRAEGDRAVEQALDCYEAILDRDPPAPPAGVRHRIEHCAVSREELLTRAAALGLSVSYAINQVYFSGREIREEVLGRERAARIHSLRAALECGIASSCNSDSPASPVDPCLALRTATTRLMRDGDDVLGPFQQLTIEQALRTITRNPAEHVLLGGRAGALCPGMLADLVVLDRDPHELAPERLHELRVLETWVGGRRQRWASAGRRPPLDRRYTF